MYMALVEVEEVGTRTEYSAMYIPLVEVEEVGTRTEYSTIYVYGTGGSRGGRYKD